MMKPTDRILDTTRGDPETAISYAKAHGAERIQEVEAFIRECYRLCPLVGIDASLVVSQSAHETSDWDSSWWVERLNSSGLGITGDAAQNQASGTWQTGTDAARGQIVHLWQYTSRDFSLPTVLFPFQDLDPRLGALRTTMFPGTVRTLNDLTGRWAVDRQYATLIAERGNAIWPTLPDQTTNPQPSPGETPVPDDITYGLVPMPPMQDRIVTNSTAWNDLGTRIIRGVAWHRMLGTLVGTDGYFRGDAASRALTDYGVGVGTDGANDGVIFKWNDPRGRRSPWANGPVNAPYGDGKAFVDRYGINASQRDLVSIEISGQQTTPLTEKSRQAIAHLTAYWADQYQVPWEHFPAVPNEARSFVIWHEELTFGTGKRCPFEVVKDETPALIERTRGILHKYQISDEPVPVPPPTPVPPPAGIDYPDHLDKGIMERMFGVCTGEDGRQYRYTEDGAVSKVWRENYGSHGWPPLVEVWSYEDRSRRYFRFGAGPTLFVGADGVPVVLK